MSLMQCLSVKHDLKFSTKITQQNQFNINTSEDTFELFVKGHHGYCVKKKQNTIRRIETKIGLPAITLSGTVGLLARPNDNMNDKTIEFCR